MAVIARAPMERLKREIRPSDNLVVDAVRAGLLRQRYLDQATTPSQLSTAASVLIDLNGIQILTPQAASEMVGSWIAGVQRTAKISPIVAVTAQNPEILRNVHAGLRDSRIAAFALLPLGEEIQYPVVIGSVSKADRETLEAIRSGGPIAGGSEAESNQFEELHSRGLLRYQDGRYSYPARADFAEVSAD